MSNNSIYLSTLLIFFALLRNVLLANENPTIISESYFPANNKITLIYESSFGESITKYYQDGEFTVSSSQADNFKYKQTLIIKNDGVFVKETYQYLKIFLLIKKESLFTYRKPLLRFPLPLTPGMQWEWEGDEFSNGDTNKVKITGKAFNKEFVQTKAGRFEAIKLESFVEGSGNAKNRVTEWYAEGIGMIKTKIIIEGGGIMGFLRDILGYGWNHRI